MTIDRHTLALLSIVGCSLDVLGSLYLAYDLLGGEHGPLRTLTRAVTYGVIFGVGYGLAFGPLFGIVSGAVHGITLGWEFSRAARRESNPGFWYDAAMSAIRGASFAVCTAYLYGARFGVTFGALSTLGQVVAYQRGIRPTMNYQPGTRLRFTRLHLIGVILRTFGYAVAGCISGLIAHQGATALSIGLKFGLVIGLVTAILGFSTSFVEWSVDHLPEKVMGVFGVGLLLVGFAMQSIQYWVALLDVSVVGK
jgi:hypothetical protein